MRFVCKVMLTFVDSLDLFRVDRLYKLEWVEENCMQPL